MKQDYKLAHLRVDSYSVDPHIAVISKPISKPYSLPANRKTWKYWSRIVDSDKQKSFSILFCWIFTVDFPKALILLQS